MDAPCPSLKVHIKKFPTLSSALMAQLLMVLVPDPLEQQSIRACLVLIERCLSVVTDASTMACIKRFQASVEELEEAGEKGLSEDDIQGLIEVSKIEVWTSASTDGGISDPFPLNTSLQTFM